MSLTGTWSNSYGSVMTLEQYSSGLVGGSYQSSTGSTGVYNVIGFAPVTPPTPQLGQSVALSIYWRSTQGGQGDPSWHWVSGLSGQLNIAGAEPTIYLMHAMVATDDFPGLATVGTYIDKLLYTPKTGSALEIPARPGERATEAAGADPISGVWKCREIPGATLSVNIIDDIYGYVSGQLTLPAGTYGAIGFTDTYATQDGVPRQALSMSLVMGAQSQSMAGSLEFSTGVLTLSIFTSQGTPGDAIYVETKLSQLTFVKS